MTMRQTHVNGPVPDGWRWVRLGDVCTKPEYGAAATAIEHKPDRPRYVRISDITDDGRLRSDDIRSADPANVEGFELSEGDFLFARSGSVGRTYRYRFKDGACVFAGYLIRFRPLSEHLDISYLEHWTHSPAYHRWIESTARRGAQTNINATEYSSLPILLPPLAEQRTIAAVLDSIDEAIGRTEEVIAATETLRDSLLHEQLTRGVPGWHTEWKDVPGIGPIPADWEVVRLGDVAEVKGGKRLPKGSGFASENTGLPYIRVVDFDQRTVSTRNLQYVTPDVQNLIRRYTINSTDLYISIAGTIGLVGTVPEVLNGANLTENAAKITMIGSTILTQGFAVAFLSGLAGQSQIASRINKLGQPKLALERIKTIGVPLPQLDEQRKIVGLLNRVDHSIDQARMGLKALRSVKTSSADALLAASAPVGLNRLT